MIESATSGRSVRLENGTKEIAAPVALKTPGYLTTQRRVPWNAQERRVEQDAMKHDAMLASLRASFTWQASGTLTTPEWRAEPGGILPDVLDKISAVKQVAAQEREAELHEQDIRRLHRRLHKSSLHAHPHIWDKSQRVSHYLNETLWRHPDPTPNIKPSLNFRPKFRLAPGQAPWMPNDEFPQATQTRPVPLYGSPVRVPLGTFQKFSTTGSCQSIVRPAVSGQIARIEAELAEIPDDGTTVSVQNYREGVARDLQEMKQTWNRVRRPSNLPESPNSYRSGELREPLKEEDEEAKESCLA